MAVSGNNNNEQSGLRQHAGASVAELQQFISQLKGKSPQEAMGLLSQSGLVRSTMVATVATAALIFVFTAGPYFLRGAGPAKAGPDTAKSADANDQQQPAAEQKAGDTSNKEGTPVASPTPGKKGDDPKKDDVLDKLGMSETKPASPKANPLEKTNDDILKDLK